MREDRRMTEMLPPNYWRRMMSFWVGIGVKGSGAPIIIWAV